MLLKAERWDKITALIEEKGVVSTSELTHHVPASRSTIRRDLEDLEKINRLKRTRGGAMVSKSRTSDEPPFAVRKDVFLDEKRRIAQAALQFIHEKETLLLDGGTTVLELSKALRERSNLYIATNDLNSAAVLAENTEIDLTVLGGVLRKHYYSMNGYFTEWMIKQIHADKVFLGVDAVDMNIGLMNFSVEEIQSKKLMIQAAHEVIVLCDHSKFDMVAFVNICRLDEVSLLITGKEADPQAVQHIREMGVRVLTV